MKITDGRCDIEFIDRYRIAKSRPSKPLYLHPLLSAPQHSAPPFPIPPQRRRKKVILCRCTHSSMRGVHPWGISTSGHLPRLTPTPGKGFPCRLSIFLSQRTVLYFVGAAYCSSPSIPVTREKVTAPRKVFDRTVWTATLVESHYLGIHGSVIAPTPSMQATKRGARI